MKKNILMLHGWDFEAYSKMTTDKYVWDYCDKLLSDLEKDYNVYKLNFPGFCGEKEPKKAWNVEDFASFVNDYINKNNLKIDIIIGYSFGGAVAVSYKNTYKKNEKLLLVAPAIIRNFNHSKSFAQTPKILDGLRNIVRNVYVSYIVKTPEMRYGTKFLRNTYQIIVRRDLRDELLNIAPKDLLFLFGDKDDAVDPQKMNDTLKKEYKDRIVMIKGADHDNIVTSYASEIIINLKKLTK